MATTHTTQHGHLSAAVLCAAMPSPSVESAAKYASFDIEGNRWNKQQDLRGNVEAIM